MGKKAADNELPLGEEILWCNSRGNKLPGSGDRASLLCVDTVAKTISKHLPRTAAMFATVRRRAMNCRRQRKLKRTLRLS